MNSTNNSNVEERINHNKLKRKVRQLKLEKKYLKGYIYILSIICIGLLSFGLYKTFQCSNKKCTYEKEIVKLQNEKEQAEKISAETKSLIGSYNKLTKILYDVSEITVDLDKENQQLKKDIKITKESLNKLAKNKKLYDKYNWALYSDNQKTDISYDRIESLFKLVKEKDISEDVVDLILAITMTESDGNEKCTSDESSAVGLGQFLSETGEFVYKNLMGNTDYDHYSVASNGEINLKMMVYYLEWLNIQEKGDVEEVINRYRGLNSPGYKEKINYYLAKNGKNISKINIKDFEN